MKQTQSDSAWRPGLATGITADVKIFGQELYVFMVIIVYPR